MTWTQLAGDRSYRGRDNHAYFADERLWAAANAALYLQVPLLLSGEPGCGKTDFAWVAAQALAHAQGEQDAARAVPLECYIRSDSTATDLLVHYDALARLKDNEGTARDPRHHMELAPLGRALMSLRRQVVLLDEIDKAPRDLSNDLLRELDQGHFTIKEIARNASADFPDPNVDPRDGQILLQRNMMRPKRKNAKPGESEYLDKPLVIVTSNAERQLPEAFLRRCVYHHIEFPTQAQLQKILRSRLPQEGAGSPPRSPQAGLRESLIDAGVLLVHGLRGTGKALSKKPGTSEIIGWLKTILVLGAPSDQNKVLEMGKQVQKGPKIPWLDLPGLHCLVKLKTDLDLLRS